MRIAVAGAGPAGLYFSYLMKRRRPETAIDVFEQNPADATFGFGVVFSDRALDFLRADDPETVAAIVPRMEQWRDMTLVHRGERVVIDGVGFSAIGRLQFLQLLQARVRSVGIAPRFGTRIEEESAFAGYDLVVAADGVNSFLRKQHEAAFGTSAEIFSNRFIWFGTGQPFATLTQTFVETEFGAFNAHHYRYTPAMSTFIVECGRDTFARAGFAAMTPEEGKAQCERIFADTLAGEPLISNKSEWRDFPWIRNARWSHGNIVLIGDALHTAHFSIGSGTRLALEDAIALVEALEAQRNVPDALAAFEANRRPILEKIVDASRTSARWYENFAGHMKLAPLDFAMSYITRSGRIDDAKLREMSPRFMARFEGAKAQ